VCCMGCVAINQLSAAVRDAIASAEHETQCCSGFLINICLSYGARQEIVSACKAIAQAVASGSIAADSVGEFS
jgi:undecaprenyl diphosphate synthase